MTSNNTYPAQPPIGADIEEMTVAEFDGLPWNTFEVNTERAQWAFVAVVEHAKHTGTYGKESLPTVLGDLIGNLRHLADAAGLDFDDVVADTVRCYQEELAEQHSPV